MDGSGIGWNVEALAAALSNTTPWIRLQKHLLGHGCETAEPQQDSRPRPKGWPIGLRKAKRDRWMDGWGWNGVEALAVAHSSTVDS